MTAIILPWWRERTAREQGLLTAMAVLLALVLLWLGIVRPLATARATAMARHDAAVRDLGMVQAMTVHIRSAERRSSPLDASPLVELVGRRASEAGLTTETMASSGDGRVTLRIGAVRPQMLLGWLAQIEARDGIRVERLTIDSNDDASVAVGLTLGRAR